MTHLAHAPSLRQPAADAQKHDIERVKSVIRQKLKALSRTASRNRQRDGKKQVNQLRERVVFMMDDLSRMEFKQNGGQL